MENKIPAIFNWSGGKDSVLALDQVLKEGVYDVRYLMTTINDAYNRVSMHGVREALLIQQAESIGIPLYQLRLPDTPSMKDYENTMRDHLMRLKTEGITHSIFGDILLEDLRKYREDKLSEIGLTAVFPLWKRDTVEVLKAFITLDYKTVVVCAREGLGDFCGRIIDEQFIADLPQGVDPCGENGEFHTFAFDGPIFKNRVDFTLGEKLFQTFPSPVEDQDQTTGYWYIDLIEKS